ncbi:MAG: GNAT family N-acetyltransferase [Phormidesmis sp.]
MIDYKIRLAEAADVVFLPAIERAAAQQFLPYLDWLGIPASLMEGLTTPHFLSQAQADGRLWVAIFHRKDAAMAAAQPVGFIVTKFLSESCFVVELDVHPNYGQRGIGTALVEACCQSAQRRGFSQVTLTTFRKVPWNIPFYQRLGFEVLPEEKWSPEIKAIVNHEARYGFAPEKRVVMRRMIDSMPLVMETTE